MKTSILYVSFLLYGLFSFGQNVIKSDTVISKTVRVNESFELQFLDWPGTGSGWNLTERSDTTNVSVRLLKQVLAEGYGPLGGKYITFYRYTGLNKGVFKLEYHYGRPWLKEKLYECMLEITVI